MRLRLKAASWRYVESWGWSGPSLASVQLRRRVDHAEPALAPAYARRPLLGGWLQLGRPELPRGLRIGGQPPHLHRAARERGGRGAHAGLEVESRIEVGLGELVREVAPLREREVGAAQLVARRARDARHAHDEAHRIVEPVPRAHARLLDELDRLGRLGLLRGRSGQLRCARGRGRGLRGRRRLREQPLGLAEGGPHHGGEVALGHLVDLLHQRLEELAVAVARLVVLLDEEVLDHAAGEPHAHLQHSHGGGLLRALLLRLQQQRLERARHAALVVEEDPRLPLHGRLALLDHGVGARARAEDLHDLAHWARVAEGQRRARLPYSIYAPGNRSVRTSRSSGARPRGEGEVRL